jgi:hypothetical protein
MIKRYEKKLEFDGQWVEIVPFEFSEGEWVKYKDHLTVIPKWISVKDKMPEEGERVAITDGVYYGAGIKRHAYSDHWWMFDLNPTHWMPLPQPPEVKE